VEWTPDALDVATRAAAVDAGEVAALIALLRRRWPHPPQGASIGIGSGIGSGSGSSLGGSGSGAPPGADGDEGQEGGGERSLLELTAAVYRRGGARGPRGASRLPALVVLFLTLQQPLREPEAGPQPQSRLLGANDGVAYLQVRDTMTDNSAGAVIDPMPLLLG
jgi:hypothetical protein